jgi:hypothetical protein
MHAKAERMTGRLHAAETPSIANLWKQDWVKRHCQHQQQTIYFSCSGSLRYGGHGTIIMTDHSQDANLSATQQPHTTWHWRMTTIQPFKNYLFQHAWLQSRLYSCQWTVWVIFLIFFLLQEHWLTPANLCQFNAHLVYFTRGCSAVTNWVDSGMLVGRPFGGVIAMISNCLRKSHANNLLLRSLRYHQSWKLHNCQRLFIMLRHTWQITL